MVVTVRSHVRLQFLGQRPSDNDTDRYSTPLLLIQILFCKIIGLYWNAFWMCDGKCWQTCINDPMTVLINTVRFHGDWVTEVLNYSARPPLLISRVPIIVRYTETICLLWCVIKVVSSPAFGTYSVCDRQQRVLPAQVLSPDGHHGQCQRGFAPSKI